MKQSWNIIRETQAACGILLMDPMPPRFSQPLSLWYLAKGTNPMATFMARDAVPGRKQRKTPEHNGTETAVSNFVEASFLPAMLPVGTKFCGGQVTVGCRILEYLASEIREG